MIDVWNRVNGNIQYFVKQSYPTFSNFTSDKESTPPAYPCICIEQVDNIPQTDLEMNELIVTSVIEVKTFSNKDLDEARKYSSVCDSAMSKMGFIRKYGPAKIGNIDPKIKSMIARYQRPLGGINQIPQWK